MNENFILSSNNKTAFLESVSGDMPCIDVNTQRGGRFIVNSITDRNNIPKKKRTLGMKAYVVESGQEFILIKDSDTEHTSDDCWVDKFTILQNDLLDKLEKLNADVTNKLNEMKSQYDQKIADLNKSVDIKISSFSKSISEMGYGIKEINFNNAYNGYILFTNGFLINVVSAPGSMGEHDWLTIKFVKPFSIIYFCGGLNNTLNLGGDGDNKLGPTVRRFDRNGVTFVGPENSSGTPMAIAMGRA